MKTLLAAVLLAFATVSPVLACLKASDSPSACAAAPAPKPTTAPATRANPEAAVPKRTPAPARTAPASLLM